MIDIKTIIDMLNQSPLYNVDSDIDIAKGKYKAPTNWSEIKNYYKRNK